MGAPSGLTKGALQPDGHQYGASAAPSATCSRDERGIAVLFRERSGGVQSRIGDKIDGIRGGIEERRGSVQRGAGMNMGAVQRRRQKARDANSE